MMAKETPPDKYVATYCTRCAQLQWHDFIGKPCQFCGNLEFANVRPEPTLTQIDRRYIKRGFLKL